MNCHFLTRRKSILMLVIVLLTFTVSFAGWHAQAGRWWGNRDKSFAVAKTNIAPVAPPMFATRTVTKTADTNDGVCDADCSLREAIAAAAAGDTITFAVTGTITLTSGELAINKNLTIQGPGANLLTISGNNASRVFNISAGNYNVAISNLTIANGRARGANGPNSSTPGDDGEGGGIFNASTGTLTLTNCVLSSNMAVGGNGFGGPTASAGGHARGGGIFNASTGRIDITNSTLSSNAATGGSGGSGAAGRNGGNGDGGGIYNANTGIITLTNSTLSSNSATGGAGGAGSNNTNGGSATGGGIHNASTGRVDITNSTLSGNSATGGKGGQGSTGGTGGNGFGGGVYNAGTGEVNLFNSTLTLNSIMAGAGGSPSGASGNGNGSGVYNNSTGTFKVRSSIIAGNANSGVILDAQGTFTSQGYNFIGDGQTAIGFGGPADQVGGHLIPLDPQLGSLANNGGPTQTHRPLANSLVIDKGNSFGLTIDQRGFSRTINNPAISNAGDGTDIGSVELLCDSPTTNPLVLTINPSSDPNGAAQELINAINCANDDPAATTIQLVCGTYSYSTANNWEFGPNALPIIQSNITIQGNGAVLNSTATTRLRFFYVAGQNVGGLTSGTLTLQDLTLQNGKQKGGDSKGNGGGSGMGGAIFNHGALTLERVTLQSNTATGGSSINATVTFLDLGGGGIGEDGRPTQNQGGGFGGTPIGTGGTGGTSFGTQRGGGGGGFRPGDNGGNATSTVSGAGGGAGLLGGKGGGFGSDGGAPGDGGGGGAPDISLPGSNGPGGAYGFGGIGGSVAGGGGGGVGGGGGGGMGGGGGFGGGGLGTNGTGRGGGGGFGGGGGRGAGPGGFAGGNGGACCNTFGGGGGGGLGGAIFNHLGTLTLINTTLTGNIAQGGNGSSSTQVGNGGGGSGGSGFGGAIFNLNGTVTVTSTTLAGNTVTAGAAGTGVQNGSPGSADGGAIYNLAYGNTFTGGTTTAMVTLSNSILANSSGTSKDLINDKRDGTGVNTATINLSNANLVETQMALNSATAITAPTFTADPSLGTLTILSNCVAGTCKPAVLPLLSGSPAINAATGTVPTTDETGTARGSTPDLGAYERCCQITAFNVTGGGAVCAGGAGATVNLSGSQIGVNYQLFLNGTTPIGAAVPGTGNALSFLNLTMAGTYTVGASDASCSLTMNNSASITVTTVPTPTITSGGATTFCTGDSVTLNSSSASGNQWYLNGNPIGGATNSSYVATASGNYSVSVTANSCTSTISLPTTVTVNPNPVVNPVTPAAICSGGATNIALSSTPANASFTWTIGTVTGNVTGQAAGSGTTIAQTLTGSGAVTYIVTPTLDSCPGTPLNIVQTVNATTTTTALLPQTVCPSTSPSFTTTASGTGPFTFVWKKGATILSTSITSMGNTSTLLLSNVQDGDAGSYSVEVTGACGTVTQSATLNVQPLPTIAINNVTKVEGNASTSAYNFTVSLSAANTCNAVTVEYATANGSATAGSDYEATSGTLTFASGETVKTVTVQVNGDLTVEADETFFVNLTNPTHATFLDNQGGGAINNDDSATLAITDVTQNEGTGGTTNFTFAISLSAPADQPVSVNFATADGTATLGDSDYVAQSGFVTFPANTTTAQMITIVVNGDIKVEAHETFSVNLTPKITPYPSITITDNQGLGTITNDDVATLSIDDLTVTEGNSGTTNATFTVNLSNPSDSAVTVQYQTSNGTATAGSDYTAAALTILTFNPGDQTKTITIPVSGDTTVEANETFAVKLSNASGATIADAQGLGTINNDDSATVAINDVTQVEGNAGTTNYVFNVSLSNPVDQAVTVNYATADGTATTADSDYVTRTGSVTFAANSTTAQTITISVTGDLKVEGNETFFVNLAPNTLPYSGVTLADAQGQGTLTNDDASTVAINDVTVTEGNSGTVNATFTLSLSHPVDQWVSVYYQTQNATATTADNDYVAATSVVNFAPGTTIKTIDVVVKGDTQVEPTETFLVNLRLTPPVVAAGGLPGSEQVANVPYPGITLADSQGIGTITNDDFPPFTSALTDPFVCNGIGSSVQVTAQLTNPNATSAPATFNVNLPALLTLVPGSCTASNGVCGPVSATQVGWSGTLAAGEVLTLTYQAQIADGTPLGTLLTINSTGSVNGVQVTTSASDTVSCPGNSLNVDPVNVALSAQKAGSVLVFPYYTSKASTKADTRMSVSNVGTQQAYLHIFLLDGATCQQADYSVCLTPNGSFTFTASEVDPETSGWVLVVATDAQGKPIQNNALVGNAFLKDGLYVGNYGAEAFWAHSANVATLNGNTATLRFDDTGYDAVPNQFAIEVQSPRDVVGQKLITVGLSGDLNEAQLTGAGQIGAGLVYNANENPFGSFVGFLTGTCQASATITSTNPRVPFTMGGVLPSGQAGTIKLNIGSGVGLLLTPQNATKWSGIRGLHKTASTFSTITIPLSPPIC